MSTPHGAVVVGVEDGPDARRAAQWAAAEADRRSAPLHLVHAVDVGFHVVPPTTGEYRSLMRRADRVIAQAREELGPLCSRPVSTQVVERTAAAALVAASETAALVVVGAHGHPLGYDLLVGSVSLHLAHYATSPVVVVREQADPSSRRVLVGVDGSADSEAALGYAFEAADREDLAVIALHGWAERFPDVGDLGARIGAHEALLTGALAPWLTKYPDVVVTAEAVAMHPARLLTQASTHARLLVVGACGRSPVVGMRLGSIGQAALHHGRCPVAVAR